MDRIETPIDETSEQRKMILRDMVAKDEHLKALTQIINNQHYSDEELMAAVRHWNSGTEWSGGYVEEEYSGHGNRKLKVMMDHQGHIRISATPK